MSGLSEADRNELQRDHPSFNEKLDGCRKEVMKTFDSQSHTRAALTFYNCVRDAVESVCRHDMLYDTAFRSFYDQLTITRDRLVFERILDQAIEHLKDR